jgi:hypothetical protein
MPTVTTSTSAGAFGFPPMSFLERAPDTGHLWVLFRSTDTQVSVYRSTDNGATWGSQGSFTRTGLYDVGEARIDQAGDHIHLTYLTNESSQDRIYYKRIDIRSGSASLATGEVQVAATANGGVARGYWHSCSIYPYKNPDGSFAVVIPSAFRSSGGSGVYVHGLSIRNDAVLTTRKNDGLIRSTRSYRVSGDDTGGLTVCCDVEHNGDGYTTKTPNVWIAYQVHGVAYALKLTWQGYKTGWASPTTAPTVAVSRTSSRDLPARWDGKRFVIMSTNPTDTTKMDVFERDAGNTKNVAKRTSPTHPNLTTTINANMMSYNHVTQDLRIFGVGVGGGTVYYVDFIRATATWGTWTQANAVAPVTSEWGIRRSTHGTNQYDVYQQSGASSPYTISTYALAVNYAPSAPTWVTGKAGTPDTNGAAFDVASTLLLDWNFIDANKADTQQTYALQRQIGVAAVQWWRTSDSTWQLAETFNTSSTSALTLTAAQWVGGGGAADVAHVYKVKVTDSGGLVSAYSAGLAVVPSTRVDPTLTAPVADAILASGVVAATWTVSEQSAYRVRVMPSVANDAFSRTTSNGWGSADYGGPWTVVSGGVLSDYAVSGGLARQTHTVRNTQHEIRLMDVIAADVNVLINSITVPGVSTGNANEVNVRARWVDTVTYVDVRVFFRLAGEISIVVRSLIGGVESFSPFVVRTDLPGAGPVSVRFVAEGETLKARVWSSVSNEPNRWDVECPAGHVAAGALTVGTVVTSTNTNALPYTFTIDGIVVSDASLAYHDSGWVTESTPGTPQVLSYDVPTLLPDGYAGLLTFQTRNMEGLASVLRTVPFTVDFVEPAAPVVTALTATPATGGITLTLTQVAPVAGQPGTTRMELYRRKVVYSSPANSNPYFEVDAADWGNVSYTSAARSTTVAHQGVASLFLTPSGAAASPYVQTVTITPMGAVQRWEARAWFRSTTALRPVRLKLQWYNVSNVLISESVRDFTVVAGVWVWARHVATAPPTAVGVRWAIGQINTPAATDTLYVDEAVLIQANDDRGIRLDAGVESGETVLDWRAVTGVDYEYAGYAVGDNGTDVLGPWQM